LIVGLKIAIGKVTLPSKSGSNRNGSSGLPLFFDLLIEQWDSIFVGVIPSGKERELFQDRKLSWSTFPLADWPDSMREPERHRPIHRVKGH